MSSKRFADASWYTDGAQFMASLISLYYSSMIQTGDANVFEQANIVLRGLYLHGFLAVHVLTMVLHRYPDRLDFLYENE